VEAERKSKFAQGEPIFLILLLRDTISY